MPTATEHCGVRGYDMACVRTLGHEGKHRGVHVPGRREPTMVWWDPADLPLIGDDDAST